MSIDDWGRPTVVVENLEPAVWRYGGKAVEETAGTRVEAIVDEWRIDDEWWRTPIHRHYVEVVLEGGAHVVLFEDLTTGEWFMQQP